MAVKTELAPDQCELALLGSMLLSKEALKYGLAHVKETDFTDPRGRTVFQIIEDLNGKGSDVDLAIVSHHWEASGDGKFDHDFLLKLDDSVPTSAHAHVYAERVRHTAILREFQAICGDASRDFDSRADAREVLENFSAELRRLVEEAEGTKQERFDLAKAFASALELIEEQADPKAHYPFGVTVLDKAFSGGMLPGELVVVGGFPGHGKTSFALWVARTNLALGHKCLFLSYEMREGALIHRFFSQELGIPASRLRGGNGKLPEDDQEKLKTFCESNAELPFVVIDDVSLRLSGIENAVEMYRPKLMFLDYLQLVRGDSKRSQRRYEAVEDLMHGLARLAHRTGIAIVLLSQLRKPEGDSEPIPRLHLLKDSSSIEQAANAVILVQLESAEGGERQFKLTIAKNRSGELLYWTPVFFDAPLFRFGTAETREGVLHSSEATKSV